MYIYIYIYVYISRYVYLLVYLYTYNISIQIFVCLLAHFYKYRDIHTDINFVGSSEKNLLMFTRGFIRPVALACCMC